MRMDARFSALLIMNSGEQVAITPLNNYATSTQPNWSRPLKTPLFLELYDSVIVKFDTYMSSKKNWCGENIPKNV